MKSLAENYLNMLSNCYGNLESYKVKAKIVKLKEEDIVKHYNKNGNLRGFNIQGFDSQMRRDLEYILELGLNRAIEVIKNINLFKKQEEKLSPRKDGGLLWDWD